MKMQTLVSASAAILIMTGAASAHATLEVPQAEVNSDHEAVMRVSHGCILPAGQTVFFPIVQECADSNVAWAEIPADGEDPHSLERPALSLLLLAAAQDDHHGHSHGGHDNHVESMPVKVGYLEIVSPMIRATPPNAPVSAGYMVIRNGGPESDRLIGGSAPFAGKIEIHSTSMEGDVMRMREIEGGLEIPAGGTVTLERGGLHVMFMELGERMQAGETRTITLVFEKAGEVEFELPVMKVEGGSHHHHHHGSD